MAPPPKAQRFNAKARGSVAGGSTHKKGKAKRRAAAVDHQGDDALPPPPPEPTYYAGLSSKKRKRLDSYIAKKLLLERRDETLQKLSALQATSAPLDLFSTATLGQSPYNPTTAKERADIAEDRLVRRGIDKLAARRGVGPAGDSDSDDSASDGAATGKRRKGKERAVEVIEEVEDGGVKTTVLPTKAELRKAARSKGTGKAPRKANWNANLLKTQPDSESSDFDSSDSANDSEPEAGPSRSRSASPSSQARSLAASAPSEDARAASPLAGSSPKVDAVPSNAAKAAKASVASSAGSALAKPAGSALKTAAGSALAGSALKKAGDGAAFKPRVVIRGPKKFARVRASRATDGETDSDDSASDASSSELDDDENSEDDEDDEDGKSDEDDASDDEEDEDESDNGALSGEDGSPADEAGKPAEPRSKGFKSWALSQMSQSTSSAPDLLSQPVAPASTRAPIPKTGEFVGPLGAKLDLPATSLLTPRAADATASASEQRARPTIARPASVAEARMELPILAEEQAIVEAIRMNSVVVICGETGSGKTTQVPQMLYEAGFGLPQSDNPGMIAITQPRRVAALSLAARVKAELGLPASSAVVAHQIRYSSTTAPETAIKFMTDGVLLRELATDFLLSRYSVVVVDEAHERGVNTDVLIGVLSRVARLREKMWREAGAAAGTGAAPAATNSAVKPLRIVVMSATLRVADFAENAALFPTPPPVIHIGARQYPVTLHFSRRTTSDYVDEAFRKVCKIHARLPPGGVLVFMTGQNEITGLCKRLEKKYGKGKAGDGGASAWAGKRGGSSQGGAAGDAKEAGELNEPDVLEAEDVDLGNQQDLAADIDDGIAESDDEALDTEDETDMPEIAELSDAPMHVLPLYSLLPQHQQLTVFRPPPEGHRLVIVSTNVAETSLTIPGIRYVVDTGRAKARTYDPATGVQQFAVQWISKAAAAQRAGRAGRTGPGHCYRLYSSAVFEDWFAAHEQPEILRMPIEGVVLQMKSMNIDAVANFPFPTPPDRAALRTAERLLQDLGALAPPAAGRLVAGVQARAAEGGQVTALGTQMAGFPVSPRFAKMLAVGRSSGVGAYVTAIVAGMSVGEVFVAENSLGDDGGEGEGDGDEEKRDLRRRFFKAHAQLAALGSGDSDAFRLLAAIGAYAHTPTPDFCRAMFLREKAMEEIAQLRRQIERIAGGDDRAAGRGRDRRGTADALALAPPDARQLKVIRQVLLAGFVDHIAVLESLLPKASATALPASAQAHTGVPYRAAGIDEAVYLHPACALLAASPEWVVYTDVVRAQSGKAYLKGVTRISPAWIAALAPGLVSWRTVEPARGAAAAARAARGAQADKADGERDVFVVPHLRALGIDLPAVKKRQRREGTRWVLVE